MAAGSKPTAVHFTLIFFVMLSLFLGVFAYMTYDDFKTVDAEKAALQQQAGQDKQAIATELAEKEALKTALGYDYAIVGASNDPNSVLGALDADQRNIAAVLTPAPQQPNVRATFAALAAQLNQKSQTTVQAQTSEQQSLANFQQQTAQQVQDVTAAQQSQNTAEATLRDKTKQFDEETVRIRTERDQMEQAYRDVLGQFEQLKDDFTRAQDQWHKTQRDLLATIKVKADTIAQLEDISFESPDGEVTLVDNSLKSVWINRGALDHLRPQVTFSVYTKDHRGIARSTADVKAKLEVVRVDQRSAECRILDDDLTRPIAPGDPIYSPLWQSGRTEKVAFVGIIDLDGDGKSDRELLQEIVDVNHAEIQLQILDNGQREPPEATLSVDTKFLVIGDIPNPLDFPGLDERVREIELMMEENNKLSGTGADGEPSEADKYGVQRVSLNEFLTWVGYRNQQRVFRPGQSEKYNLNAGARSAGVDEVFNDRTSGGNTSRLFQNNRIRSTEGSSVPSSGRAAP
jgi:hypothetical protein